MRKTRMGIISSLLAVALVAAAAPDAIAAFPQRRITHFGPDGDTAKQAGFPDVAFNSRAGIYVVVYSAGDETNNDKWKVYGQRVSAKGKALGGRIRISSPSARDLCDYSPPAVEYSRDLNQFLVTWDEGTGGSCDTAIYARRLNGKGQPLGARAKRISDEGYNDIETSIPAYNPQRDEWMVVWNAEGVDELGGIQNLWAQRLNDKGKEVGANDRQLTDPSIDSYDGNDAIGLAYDRAHRRYLAVVRGDDTNTSDYEVFGHLMNGKGKPIGDAQFRISHATDTNPDGNVFPPTVAYDPVRERFLVVWTADAMFDSMVDNEIDIFGRFVRSNGSLVGANDRRFSNVGPDGNTDFFPVRPDIGFNPFLGQFLLAWSGDNDRAVDEESEAWGQRVSGNGALTGKNDFRISHSGPDDDTDFAANRPAIAFDPSSCSFLVVWSSGNVGNWGSDTQEWEIWGNRVRSRCPG